MKKMKLASILILALCICFSPVANAACDYETQVQLATEASNVNANYEISSVIINVDTGLEAPEATEDDIDSDNPYVFQDRVTVNIYNLTENLKVLITGDNGYEEEFTYQETDNGTITFEGGTLENIVNYSIQVLSAHPNCPSDELRTISLVTPMRNSFHDLIACEGVDEYYCQEYIDYDLNMTEAEVLERANAIRETGSSSEEPQEEEKSWWDNVKEYLDNNPWIIYVTIGVILVIAGVATAVIVIKKRRSKVL